VSADDVRAGRDTGEDAVLDCEALSSLDRRIVLDGFELIDAPTRLCVVRGRRR
jgi:hypothetical protein